MTSLIAQFDEAMMTIYRRAKTEAKYNATVFLNMLLRNRGLATAKYLINSEEPSSGYTTLHLKGRLDLTVEAMIIEEPRWHPLFSDRELARARERLEKYRYTPSGKHA